MNIPKVKALMPMKGHSERVPNKNIRLFAGKPLFYWMLDSLLGSKYITEVIINTDSEEIADLAKGYPNVMILNRPEHLLGDMVGMNPIIENDINEVEGEYFLQTHSTNPLITCDTVDRFIEAFFEQQIHNSVFTVTKIQSRMYWKNGEAINHDPNVMLRTQDLDPIYEENSCLYLFSRSSFNEDKLRISRNAMMYPIDPLQAVDIDEEHDFIIAEQLKLMEQAK